MLTESVFNRTLPCLVHVVKIVETRTVRGHGQMVRRTHLGETTQCLQRLMTYSGVSPFRVAKPKAGIVQKVGQQQSLPLPRYRPACLQGVKVSPRMTVPPPKSSEASSRSSRISRVLNLNSMGWSANRPAHLRASRPLANTQRGSTTT